jgi:hypothetical protein
MRVALVGWDIDEDVPSALAALGLELVAFTRSFPDLAMHEDRGGWTKERCPHELGGGPETEARTFRESVQSRAAGLEPFDAVHALDLLARPAAEGLAERSPGCVRVASVTLLDVSPDRGVPAGFDADRWVADHPWTHDRWRARPAGEAGTLELVPTGALLDAEPAWPGGPPTQDEEGRPLLVLWLPREAAIDAAGVARALAGVAAEAPGFSAIVLGTGPEAHAVRTRLAEQRVRGRPLSEVLDPSPGHWSAWIAAATVVGLASDDLADDPAAWAAWSFGVPVVALRAADPSALADAVRAALPKNRQSSRAVTAGAALARGRLSPADIARGWLRVYVDALTRPARHEAARATETPAPRSALALGGRTRLVLVAIGPRALYAAWHVRPDDRASALEWLGPAAVYASLVLRLYDVTEILFDGTNAHAVWDIDLGSAEHFRTVPFESSGRSLAASLGLKTPRGHFHPLAHAGPAHLPRESPATFPPTRWLRALPRQ